MWNSNPGKGGLSYIYVLKNNGIGPAFIKEVKIHWKDSVIETDPAKFTLNTIKQKDSIINFFYNNIRRGIVVPAGEMIELVGVKNDTINSPILKRWFSNTDSLEVEIIYESVYGERWSARGVANEPKRLN